MTAEVIEEAPRASRSDAAFRSLLSWATLLMMGMSWPLWVGSPDFPTLPMLRGLPAPSGPVAWILPGLALAGLLAAGLGVAPRRAALFAVASLAWLVVLDQNRLQPWVYQYLVMATAFSASPEPWRGRLARVFLIALYVHSGLSKLDLSFADELGSQFLRAGLGPLGLEPETWPTSLRRVLALGMAAFELLVGVGLAWPRSRRLAVVGAACLHLSLVAVLGPWSLDHSRIVLVWNLAVLGETAILFWPRSGRRPPGRPPLAAWLVLAAALLPLAERSGWWDAWPSFALYASHNERTELYVHESDLRNLPPAAREHLVRRDGSPWLLLDATGWSRAVRGVPIYPSGRVGVGLAIWLAGRSRLVHPIQVVRLGRADRWTGQRDRRLIVGPGQLDREANRFLWNARPSGGPGPADRWGFGTHPAN